VKSKTYKPKKWRVSETTDYVKVRNVPEAREWVLRLRKRGEPMAIYFDRNGRIVAWQWALARGS